MSEISVLLPDGSARLLPAGSTIADLAASIGSRLAKAAIAGTVDGHEVDISTALADGAKVSVITADSDAGRHVLRHSTAHVLAQAVLQLFPGAHFTIGPAIEDGFYYDFELFPRRLLYLLRSHINAKSSNASLLARPMVATLVKWAAVIR